MHQPSGGCALVALELLLSTGAGDGDGGLSGRARGTEGGAIGGGEGAESGCKEMGAAGVAGSSAGAGTVEVAERWDFKWLISTPYIRFLWFFHVLYAYSHVPTSCNATWGLRAQLVLLQLLTPVPRCAIFDSNVSSCLLQSPETVSHLCCSEPLPG